MIWGQKETFEWFLEMVQSTVICVTDIYSFFLECRSTLALSSDSNTIFPPPPHLTEGGLGEDNQNQQDLEDLCFLKKSEMDIEKKA